MGFLRHHNHTGNAEPESQQFGEELRGENGILFLVNVLKINIKNRV